MNIVYNKGIKKESRETKERGKEEAGKMHT